MVDSNNPIRNGLVLWLSCTGFAVTILTAVI
jgi:hypothetical protein